MKTRRDRLNVCVKPRPRQAAHELNFWLVMGDEDLPDMASEEFDESDLHFAAQDGDMTRVLELLAEGRSPNAFDEISKTPLHYAAESGTSRSCKCFWKPAPM